MKPAPLVVLAGLLLALAPGVAQGQPASIPADEVVDGPIEDEPPFIDLYTFGVGDLIFEKFGHAALCLRYHDPINPAVCFNYGVTDFADGGAMVWHFLRTEQRFWVEPTALAEMLYFYRDEDRSIWRQPLPLTGAQARQLEAKLWFDTQEANRYYFYDHFFDNCTTRLRDMLDAALGGRLRDGSEAAYPLSFRELGYRGLHEMPPLIMLADFVIGRQADDIPTQWQAMFHPAVLREVVAQRLGVAPEQVFVRRGPPFPTDGSTDRALMVLIGLGFALPLLLARWHRRFDRLALAWALVPLILFGLVIWGLAIVSSISGVRWNENLLVFMPFDAAIPLLAPRARLGYVRIRLALVVAASLLCAVGIFHQPLWVPILVAFLPLAIIGLELPHGVRRPRPPSPSPS